MSKDLKHAKMLVNQAAKINLEKEITINKMQAEMGAINRPIVSSIQHNSFKNNKENRVNNSIQPLMFTQFSTYFSAIELRDLESLNSGPSGDSKLINKIIKFLYKDYKAVEGKSATGKKFRGVAKSPITPFKKELMRAMLKSRIKAESISSADYDKRLCGLDRHIKNAIRNIIKCRFKQGDIGATIVQTEHRISRPTMFQRECNNFSP